MARPAGEQPADANAPITRQFVKFDFFKVDRAWRDLPEKDRELARREFVAVLDKHAERLLIRTYTLMGLRGDADFLIWLVGEDLHDFQRLATTLRQARLGRFLDQPYSYLAATKRSMYLIKHKHPGQEGDRRRIEPSGKPYLFVYPFVKTRPWYALSKATRQGMMDHHIGIGHKYPGVKINTTYSYGIDDQEFVVAFEADSAHEFLDLVMELRETDASLYTQRDTPSFTCLAATPEDVLESIA
ncbi:MAG TPA: chlorite dismutase family protein [Dehalococcoidia bacterium]|nr:chlorite dismutase family protein [Dehalococcoidia bacterium]